MIIRISLNRNLNRALFFRMIYLIVPTLLVLASRKVASLKQKKKDFSPSALPLELAETVVCQLEPLPLLEYIDSQDGFFNIRETFSVDGFQKFFFRFCILLERKTLHVDTRRRMMERLENFKSMYFDLYYNQYEDYFCQREMKHRHTNGDWALRSLGLFDNFENSELYDQSLEMRFFRCKFWKTKFPHMRFPIPELPKAWMQLLPQTINPDILPQSDLKTDQKVPLYERNCLRRKFFLRLLAMTQAFAYFRPHEVFAYGFELISTDEFYTHPSMEKYFLYVYAMIAVMLASLNVEYEWCFVFMEKAAKFIKDHSQIVDVLHYQQIMYSYLCFFPEEEVACLKILKCVPINSQFYIQSYNAHQKSFSYMIESKLGKVLCYKNALAQTQPNRDYMFRLINEIERIITKEKQLIHKCLTVKQNYELNFEIGLVLCDIYSLCLQKIKVGSVSTIAAEKLNFIAFQFARFQDYRSIFFRCVAQPNFYDAFYFEREMNKIKTNIENQRCLVNSERWANVCFGLFILFQTIANEPNRALDWLDESCTILVKCNSDRALLCKQFKNKTVSFPRKVYNKDRKVCDIGQLLTEEKKVAEYTKLGLVSIVQNDESK
jgi:hypothetical protein